MAAVDSQCREVDGFARGDLGGDVPRLRTWVDAGQSRSIHFEPGWLVLAGLFYLAGLVACGRFFELILRSSATPVRLLPALCAYLVSHLGKYVPGKAMVVIIRAGMVVPFGARASTAAIATFYETLVMMASGGLIAAVGFALAAGSGMSVGLDAIHVRLPLWGPVVLPLYRLDACAGLGMGLVFVVVTVPGGIRPAGGPGKPPNPRGRPRGDASIHGPADGAGSFVDVGRLDLAGLEPGRGRACLRSRWYGFADRPGPRARCDRQRGPGDRDRVSRGRAPGRAGSARGVLMSVLAPAIGSDQAVIASLMLRLVWVVAELAAAAIVIPFLRRPPTDGKSLGRQARFNHDQHCHSGS